MSFDSLSTFFNNIWMFAETCCICILYYIIFLLYYIILFAHYRVYIYRQQMYTNLQAIYTNSAQQRALGLVNTTKDV